MTFQQLFEILMKFHMFDCIGAILRYLHQASFTLCLFWVRKLKFYLEHLPSLGSNRFTVLVWTAEGGVGCFSHHVYKRIFARIRRLSQSSVGLFWHQKIVDVAPIGVVINIWNLSWWQQSCDVSKPWVQLVVCSIKFVCTVVNWTDEVVFIIKEAYIPFKSGWQHGLLDRMSSP